MEKSVICTNITQIHEVMDKDDISILKNANSLITVLLTSPKVPTPMNFNKFPPVRVFSGSLSTDGIVKVVPIDDQDNEIKGCSATRNKVPVNDHKILDFSLVRKDEYLQCKTVNLNLHRIKIKDENLYCACGSSGIDVYDKNCDFIKSITSIKFACVTDVADCSTGDIIVLTEATEEYNPADMHQVTLHGQYVSRVTEGDLTDVCVYKASCTLWYPLKYNYSR